MKHQAAYCNDGDLETVADTCLATSYRCLKCGTSWRKKKRRPAGLTEDQCTWHESVPCASHPKKQPAQIP